MSIPSVKGELADLILRALATDYVSESSFEKVQTGNHYQSVQLNGTRTTGFRSSRDEFLDQIRFEGKNVLDLGSNLGEISRSARARGASLVDGFEYDPYFLQLANLINACNDATRVSFYQRDITDPAIYTEHYDIVLGFSVFTYLVDVIERIAAITDELFILETHRLTGNLDSVYLQPVLRHFPYYAMLGESDWGLPHDASEKRAIIAFAKQASTLTAGLKVGVNMQAAEGYALPSEETPSAVDKPVKRHLDLHRTPWHERFFSTFNFASADELLSAVRGMRVDVDTLAQSHDSRILEYAGWVYWLLYVQGYLQYAENRVIGPGNAYYDYIVKYYLPRARDPGLRIEMADDEKIVERIQWRFHDFDILRLRREQAFEVPEALPLPRIILGAPTPEHAVPIYEVGIEAPWTGRYVDGHHRIFVAKLLGFDAVPCEIVEEDPVPPYLRGVIEGFHFDGHHLLLHGWAMRAGRDIDLFELRNGGKFIASTGVSYRKDVQKAFPHLSLAGNSGFAFDWEYEPEDCAFISFDVVALNALLPVGRTTVCYLDGMFAERAWPPPALTDRHYHESDPASLATRSVTCLHQMLEPIRRHRALDSFASVLDWGAGCGLLRFFLAHFLPHANVTGIEPDAEAVAWCQNSGLPGTFVHAGPMPPTGLPAGAFDLVLGYTIMPSLSREEQCAWLSELHRLISPGAFIALTVYGELIRPFVSSERVQGELNTEGISCVSSVPTEGGGELAPRTHLYYQTKAYAMETYQQWFEITDYIEGGVESQQDLIIMRRR